MKVFMPVYAVAMLAVVSNMFEQASATVCTQTEACPDASKCVTVADNASGATINAVDAPTASSLGCATGKLPYISSLKIRPTGSLPAGKYGLYYTPSSDTTPSKLSDDATTGNAVTKASGACDNSYVDVGKSATKAVKAAVGCSDDTVDCALQYTATWVCQAPDACAATCTSAADTACSAVDLAVPAATPKPLTKPDTLTCANGGKAYIKSLEVGARAGTDASRVTVSFTSGILATTSLTPTKDTSSCDGKWTDVGKVTAAADGSGAATVDVTAKISCAAGTGDCGVNYKAQWACQPTAVCATTETLCPPANANACPAITTAKNTEGVLSITKPSTGFTACADGNYAYLSKLTVFPDADTATLTKASDIVVRISKDGSGVAADATAAPVDGYPKCSNTYTDLGKDTKADLKVTIGCASTATVTNCNFKYKAEWTCQTGTTPAATTKSGVAGVCPVAAWGTALVAAVAGANFAAPL